MSGYVRHRPLTVPPCHLGAPGIRDNWVIVESMELGPDNFRSSAIAGWEPIVIPIRPVRPIIHTGNVATPDEA